jgi:hypothetical protein
MSTQLKLSGQAGSVPASTANIFAAATYSTNIHNKTGSASLYQSTEWYVCAGNTKGGSITVPLTSRWTGLESAV